ncbi:U6 snRNA-associated Sm-like protein LSm2 [Malassezia pachydermatis]
MFSAFKTLTGQTVTIELKNDLAIQGTLKSVDQFLNFKLDDIKVLDEARYPHMVRFCNEYHLCSRWLSSQPLSVVPWSVASIFLPLRLIPNSLKTQHVEVCSPISLTLTEAESQAKR